MSRRMPPSGTDEFARLVAEHKQFKADFIGSFAISQRLVLRKGDLTYLASPNIGENPWRLTSFYRGEPTGHMEFSNLESLAQEVWSLSRQGFAS